MKHFSIISKMNEVVSENLLSECKICVRGCNSPGILIENCPKYGDKRRQGKITNTQGTTFLCCDETRTTKLFRDKLDGLSYAYHDLQIPKAQYEYEAKIAEQQRVNRLVHNLTSINAHSIQEIYDLVPQEILTSNYETQLTYIQNEINKDVRKAAMMFLRIAKHNLQMKSEFSIYRKLDRSDASIEFREHSIQKVLMNVLHTFFVDFADKGIFVEVENYFGKVSIDYETIQIALYHLIDNTSKYAKPDNKISIKFREQLTTVDVILSMTSLFIEQEEVKELFDEGYSGKAAKNAELHDDGIGMWRIKQMMTLNKGSVEVVNGKVKVITDGLPYGVNQIILKFMKGKNLAKIV
jgi:hypothetical protein